MGNGLDDDRVSDFAGDALHFGMIGIANDDDEQIEAIGKMGRELKAELILLEQKIAEYEIAQVASEATEPAVDESEESVSE